MTPIIDTPALSPRPLLHSLHYTMEIQSPKLNIYHENVETQKAIQVCRSKDTIQEKCLGTRPPVDLIPEQCVGGGGSGGKRYQHA